MNLLDISALLSNLEPFQIRILVWTVIGLIWAYITYRACMYVIRKEEEREEYSRKHVPPFVTIRGQNGKQQKRN